LSSFLPCGSGFGLETNFGTWDFDLDPKISQTAHRAAPTLTRMPYLPYFAEIAERWVGEE